MVPGRGRCLIELEESDVALHVGPMTVLHVLAERGKVEGLGLLGGGPGARGLVFEWLGKMT